METVKKPVRIDAKELSQQYQYIEKIRTFLYGQVRYALVKTYGCQQNEADSERLSGMLVQMGYTLTENADKADLILINTCAVREHAELKALSATGQFKHLKLRKPSLLIGLCGCMVSKEDRSEDIKHRYPYVNFSFSTGMLYRFPEILYTYLEKGNRHFYFDVPGYPGNLCEGLPVERKSTFKAWVSIMYGCNNFCSYCIVPYVRGRERSRESRDIVAEVQGLVQEGYKEITLLGQNVNSYGKDLDTPTDFADLLNELCHIEGDFILRFMTSHPKDVTPKLIDVIARNPKIARHFHLPLQSGSNEILRRMNRIYTREQYLATAASLRRAIPDIALTTDIIIGFPGETEEQFEQTLDMLRTVRYDNVYSFMYSPREGTPAAKLPDRLPHDVLVSRFNRLMELQTDISSKKNANYLGKTIEVLVEGRSKTDASRLTGRSQWDRLVHFEGDNSLIGQFIQVRITKAETYTLYGIPDAPNQ